MLQDLYAIALGLNQRVSKPRQNPVLLYNGTQNWKPKALAMQGFDISLATSLNKLVNK